MKKFEVTIALEAVAEATAKWHKAQREFNEQMDSLLARLLHEGAANYMSAAEMAKACGLRTSQVKHRMKAIGLNPANGKTLLSKQAAKALTENAALLGIEPHQMDLTSPLAYLPAGKELRQRFLETEANRGVKDEA